MLYSVVSFGNLSEDREVISRPERPDRSDCHSADRPRRITAQCHRSQRRKIIDTAEPGKSGQGSIPNARATGPNHLANTRQLFGATVFFKSPSGCLLHDWIICQCQLSKVCEITMGSKVGVRAGSGMLHWHRLRVCGQLCKQGEAFRITDSGYCLCYFAEHATVFIVCQIAEYRQPIRVSQSSDGFGRCVTDAWVTPGARVRILVTCHIAQERQVVTSPSIPNRLRGRPSN
jgi:hypothetical protein